MFRAGYYEKNKRLKFIEMREMNNFVSYNIYSKQERIKRDDKNYQEQITPLYLPKVRIVKGVREVISLGIFPWRLFLSKYTHREVKTNKIRKIARIFL